MPRRRCAGPPQPTGRLDILVNDAVFNIGGKLADTSLDDWNRTMAVNLTGVFLMCRAAIHQMQRQEIRNEVRGRIVNISSQHGMIAAPEDCRLRRLQGRRRLSHAPGRGRLCQGRHRLQRRRAGQDPDRQDRPRRRAALARLQPRPHAAAAARPLRGCRQRRPLPRIGRGDLHHRREPDGRRRLDGRVEMRAAVKLSSRA